MRIDDTVHRYGEEDIFGKKKFYDSPTIIQTGDSGCVIQNDAFSLDEEGKDTHLGKLCMVDKKGNNCISIEGHAKENGEKLLLICVNNIIDKENKNVFFTIGILPDGTPYVACPTPTNPQERSNFIATTEWVQQHIYNHENVINALKKEIEDLKKELGNLDK